MSDKNFFEVIEQEIHNGYGIIPLIGSGMSFQSGIMLGSDIGNYLNTLFCQIFLDRRPIDLHREGWPAPYQDSEVVAAREKVKELYVEICEKYGVEVVGEDEIRIKNFGIGSAFHPIEFARYINTYLARPYCPEILREISVDIKEHDEATKVILSALPQCNDNRKYNNYPIYQQDHIVEIGLRSMYDWTTALNFFSRLMYDKSKGRYSFHDESDSVIIDSFNANMVGNRKPNQNHFLLTHLVSSLNIKNIITTNFDTLIEDALRIGGMRVKVIQLEKNSSIPSQSVISDSLSVVKLHGENQSTRADETIHELPTLNDRNRIYDYFFPHYGYKKLTASHLFCLGTSLTDQRTNSLIRHVLGLKKNFKVFIAVSRSQSQEKLLNAIGSEFGEQIFFTPPHNPEYVLYELYQRLTLRLPPGGFSYQYDQFIPPILPNNETLTNERTTESDRTKKDVRYDRVTIENWLISYLKNGKGGEISLGVSGTFQEYGGAVSGNIVTLQGAHGISTFIGSIFHKLVENRVRCLWMELEDFSSPIELLSQIFYSAMLQMGRLHHEAAQIEFGDFGNVPIDELMQKIKNRIEGYISSLKLSPKNWVVFIYGRNSPGECSGLTDLQKWDQYDFEKLHMVIKSLAAFEFKVVYMPSFEDRSKQCAKNYDVFGENTQHLTEQDDSKYVKSIHEGIKLPIRDFEALYSFNSAYSTAVKVKNHLDSLLQSNSVDDSWVELRFLYACSLFRQSRHFNSLISEAALPCIVRFNYSGNDNDAMRGEVVQSWRQRYTMLGIFLPKPGGYIWKYRDIRIGIKGYLERYKKEDSKRRLFLAIKSRTHYWIGDWYHKALFATLHPTPLKEAIYHLVNAVQFAKEACPESAGGPPSVDTYKYRFSIVLRSLIRMSKIILHARDRIPSWINEPAFESSLSAKSIIQSIVGDSKSFDYSDEGIKLVVARLTGCQSSRNKSKWINEQYIEVFRSALLDLLQECRLLSQYRSKSKGLNIINGALDIRLAAALTGRDTAILVRRTFSDAQIFSGLDPWLYSNNMTQDYFEEIARILRNEIGVVSSVKSISILEQFLGKDLAPLIELELDAQGQEGLERWRLRAEVEYKKIRNELVKENFSMPNVNSLCISVLSDVAHLLIRRAKILSRQSRSVEYLECVNAAGAEKFKQLHPIEKRTWVAVTMFCSLGIDLCRFLPVSHIDFEMEASAKLHALYGLALGYLNRFSEGFRRINESLALNFFFHDTKKRHNNIACYLRRVEVILLQQNFEFDTTQTLNSKEPEPLSSNKQRRLIQLLDRAYFNLGIAQESFPTENYEPFWRGRLIMLKLRIYCIYFKQKMDVTNFSPRFLMGRLNLENEIYELFKSGINECQSDCYRKLCFFELFVNALLFLKLTLDEGDQKSMIANILDKDFFRGYSDLCECIPSILSLEVLNSKTGGRAAGHGEYRILLFPNGNRYKLPFNYAAADLLSALIKRFSDVFLIEKGIPSIPAILKRQRSKVAKKIPVPN